MFNEIFPISPQVLAEITKTWSVMSLSYETHSSTGIPLLKADENLIETLEDNQVSCHAGCNLLKLLNRYVVCQCFIL